MKIICGIDPGFSGAICIIDDLKTILFLEDMPILKGAKAELDEVLISNILSEYSVSDIYLEKAQTMPKQGISSAGRYMCSYGIVRGICVGKQISYTLVTPQRWKKYMCSDMPKGKDTSIIRAKQLFPQLQLPRKKDHGKAEALLIALWGLRHG